MLVVTVQKGFAKSLQLTVASLLYAEYLPNMRFLIDPRIFLCSAIEQAAYTLMRYKIGLESHNC
jgi:hypothetical protein